MSATNGATTSRVSTAAAGLVDCLEASLGDDLRGVGWYTPDTYEIVHSTGGAELRELELDRIADDLRLESLNVPAQEGLYEAGQCNCIVRCFDALTVLAFPVGRAAGVAVAVRSMPETPLQEVIETCESLL